MFAGLKKKLRRSKTKKNTSKSKSKTPTVHKSTKPKRSKKGGYRTKKTTPKSKSKKSSRKKKTSKRKKSMRGGAIRHASEYFGKDSGRYSSSSNHKGSSFPDTDLKPTY